MDSRLPIKGLIGSDTEDQLTLPLLQTSSPNSYSGMSDGFEGSDPGLLPSVSTDRLLTIRKGKPKSYISSPSSIASQKDLLPIHLNSTSVTEDLDDVYAIKRMVPYKRNPIMFICFIMASILTLGFLNLLCRWVPGLQLLLTALPCKVKKATHILVFGKYSGMRTSCKIRDLTLEYQDNHGMNTEVQFFRTFEYRKAVYIFDEESSIYRKSEFTMSYPFSFIHRDLGKGVDEATRLKRRTFFGKNSIEIESKNIIALLVDEVLNPFYLFQILCIVVWGIDEYYSYATAIAIMSCASAFLGLYETKRNRNRLERMTKFKCDVVRYIGERRDVVESAMLVPGDVIEIPDGPAPCDIILLSGQCIVNESMLTGESIPVLKTEISSTADDIYNYTAHKNHTIYCGTHIIQKKKQGRDKVYGIVCRTGYSTSKGALILSILFPKPNKFKFYRDSFKFVFVLFLFAMCSFLVSSIQLYRLGVAFHEILLRAMDVITIAVPPSLPIAMTVGTALAINRLKRKNIFCISPPRINVSGQIKLMCFDKTGTLTEDGLDLEGIRAGDREGFSPLIKGSFLYETLSNGGSMEKILLQALATCHSLTYIRDSLVGDPLEEKIFEATKYSLIESEDESEGSAPTVVKPPVAEFEITDPNELMSIEELAILRRFDFRSSLQRMSVIVKDIRFKHTLSFVKGSPEMIQRLCRKESIPKNFSNTLYNYANKGFRVLACAYKVMEHVEMRNVNHVQRMDAESDLTFLGLIIMSNKLKPVTPSVISTLNRSMVRSVMVTGDNPYTAISVGKQCGILTPDSVVYLGHLNKNDQQNPIEWKNADTGDVLDLYSPEVDLDKVNLAVVGDVFDSIVTSQDTLTLNWVLNRSNIFSRMTPSQKMKLVELFQDQGISVGMCGDGANDCAALKTSHIGISLSDSEASIAAPFTCTRPDISCVPVVIREGKAALATSFSMFKYIAIYSLVQSIAVVVLYSINTNLSDWQFLFVDLGLIFPIVWLIGTTKARDKLVKESPESTLISVRVFSSLGCHLIMALSVMMIAWFDLKRQSFFVPLKPKPENKQNLRCFEATVMFTVSSFATLSVGIAYSISKPFKKNISSNWLYTMCLVFLLSFMSYVVLLPDKFTMNLLKLVDLPTSYRLRLFGMCLIHLAVAYLFEKLIIIGLLGYPISKKQFQIGKKRVTTTIV